MQASSGIHEVIGLEPDEYERQFQEHGSVDGRLEPRMHSHPALGISAHAHGPTVDAARTPHTHKPKVDWDTTPLSVEPTND